jgi:CubicO group peptidase (beta-lactamase class C family)
MLLNKGEYNGQRLLSPRTVEFMTANHLEGIGDGTHMWSDYEGFGLGVEVRIKYADGKTLGSLGNYGWDGAASTYYKVDPVENAVEMIFLQYMPYDPYHIFQKFHVLHYQSMVK